MIYETYSVGGVLYHHGISGMHWGQRNGPPYPLSKSISTGSRLKSSKRIDGNKQSGLVNKNKEKSQKDIENKIFTNNMKKIGYKKIKSEYGDYYEYVNNENKKLSNGYKTKVEYEMEDPTDEHYKNRGASDKECIERADYVKKNFTEIDKDIRNQLADYFFTNRKPWAYDGDTDSYEYKRVKNMSLKQQKADFAKNLGTTYDMWADFDRPSDIDEYREGDLIHISMFPDEPNVISVMYNTDGGAFYFHAVTCEYDLKKKKISYPGIEG